MKRSSLIPRRLAAIVCKAVLFQERMDLRTALTNIHADRLWWRKVLVGGALYCSVLGYPFAAGFIVENMDNARKGYPTPLPPWNDWGTRYLLGLFAGIIDFLFFAMPVLLAGMLFFCVGIGSVIAGSEAFANLAGPVVLSGILVVQALMFAVGVAPVGRLIYIEEGGPERAMSAASLQEALRPQARAIYVRARLASLPAYGPLVFVLGGLWLVITGMLPGGGYLAVLLVWLAGCALFYAHLVVCQIYAAADKALEQRGFGRLDRQLR
jgi:hypothetical protein